MTLYPREWAILMVGLTFAAAVAAMIDSGNFWPLEGNCKFGCSSLRAINNMFCQRKFDLYQLMVICEIE
jgi:hypothetical protein